MSVSFMHSGGAHMASYRYRAAIPAQALGASLNDPTADVLIFAKPTPEDVQMAADAKSNGATIITDVCDAHLRFPHYQQLILMADAVTCSTPFLSQLIEEDLGVTAHVIPDPYELPEQAPHVTGSRLFWFGHPTNYYSLECWLPALTGYELRVMTNRPGCIPYSLDGLQAELAQADIVLLPETAPYKSPNRAVEAIRSGCFVVADYHPSLTDIPGIWTGHLVKGVEWATQHPSMCNDRLTQSQAYVRETHSSERVANAWRTILTACRSTWAVGTSPGTDGSTLTENEPLAMPI